MGKKNKKRKQYTGRDLAFVALLKGATKAGPHLDHKREVSKRGSRDWEQEMIDAAEEEFFDLMEELESEEEKD